MENLMEEIGPSTTREPSPQAEAIATSIGPQSEMQSRRAERQREFMADALSDPDAKAALLGAAVAELFEFAPILKQAILDAVAGISDPAVRLGTLVKGLQMQVNLCKLGGKLL